MFGKTEQDIALCEAFDKASVPIESEILERIKLGLPVENEWTVPGLMNCKRAWAKLPPHLRT